MGRRLLAVLLPACLLNGCVTFRDADGDGERPTFNLGGLVGGFAMAVDGDDRDTTRTGSMTTTASASAAESCVVFGRLQV